MRRRSQARRALDEPWALILSHFLTKKNKNETRWVSFLFFLAEARGFEPPRHCCPHDFESCAFNHSATLPLLILSHKREEDKAIISKASERENILKTKSLRWAFSCCLSAIIDRAKIIERKKSPRLKQKYFIAKKLQVGNFSE